MILALEQSEFTGWHWLLFVAGFFVLITLDLRVFHRSSHPEPFRTALGWTIFWFTLASLFALAVGWFWSKEDALQFATGYLIELSLSMDNVFVMALIFSYFAIPADSQHRVLFFGIIGAMLLRGIMIWAGVELVQRLEWMLEIFGAFLAISGVKVIFFNQQVPRPERNPVIRLARRLLPFSSELDGQRFVTYTTGSRLFTPLALVLIAIETSDVVFALDSIPAISTKQRRTMSQTTELNATIAKPTTASLSQFAASTPKAASPAKRPQPETVQYKIRFELEMPNAWRISVAGTFNDWKEDTLLMNGIGGGKWARELSLAPSRYEYRFVVDGQWIDDPKAKGYVPKPTGGRNAVLYVWPPKRADSAII